MSAANGLKLPLVINSSMLVAGLIAVVTLWNQTKGLAEDIDAIQASPVTGARVVAIEIKLENLKTAVDKLGDAHVISTNEILKAIRNQN